MWLQEPRYYCRIFIILFQSSCARFCRDLNFLSNSRSFETAFTWDLFLLAAKFHFSEPVNVTANLFWTSFSFYLVKF